MKLSFICCPHRCTVVGNPGRVLGFFWQILLRGVLGVVRKSGGGGVLFYYIIMWKFFKNRYRGYMKCPLLSPLCASMAALFKKAIVRLNDDVWMIFFVRRSNSKRNSNSSKFCWISEYFCWSRRRDWSYYLPSVLEKLLLCEVKSLRILFQYFLLLNCFKNNALLKHSPDGVLLLASEDLFKFQQKKQNWKLFDFWKSK